jgi:hypothetical protein
MAFLKLFLSVSMLGRGIVVLVLAIGLATLVALGLALRSRALTRREVLMALALALPPAAFWLPNPQPARHFFFVVLAASLLAAVWVAKRTRNAAAAVVIALVVAIANQLAAEGVRPVIDSRYAWAYPSASPRRATQQAPLGAFPLDQRANQVQVALEREEALALVRRAPRELIVLGDFEYYIIAHLLAADRALRWTEEVRDGLVVHELRSAERRLVFIEKNSGWPRDVTAEILSRESWRDWPVYVQPTTISRYDRTEVPAARRYEVGLERRVQALRKQ